MHHLLRSLQSLLIGAALLLCSAAPIFADAGVTIETTVTVTGGSSGGGYYGGGTTYVEPTNYNPLTSHGGYIAPVQQPVALPTPSVSPQQLESATVTDNPVKEEFKIDWFLIVCLITIVAAAAGIIFILIKRRRKY